MVSKKRFSNTDLAPYLSGIYNIIYNKKCVAYAKDQLLFILVFSNLYRLDAKRKKASKTRVNMQ